MASSLRLITSNLVKRSFRPTLVSASRLLSINRSYTTKPTDDIFDQSWPRTLWPKISYLRSTMEMTAEGRNLHLNRDKGASIINMNMPGLKRENLRVSCADQHSTLFIQDKTQFANKDEIMTNIIANIVANFRDISTKHSWPYYDLFNDRSIIGKEVCPLLAMLSPLNTFTIYKEEVDGWLYTGLEIFELKKIKLTKQGLVMPLFQYNKQKRGDIKTSFAYDTLFIEQKRKNIHRIRCIRLPEA